MDAARFVYRVRASASSLFQPCDTTSRSVTGSGRSGAPSARTASIWAGSTGAPARSNASTRKSKPLNVGGITGGPVMTPS